MNFIIEDLPKTLQNAIRNRQRTDYVMKINKIDAEKNQINVSPITDNGSKPFGTMGSFDIDITYDCGGIVTKPSVDPTKAQLDNAIFYGRRFSPMIGDTLWISFVNVQGIMVIAIIRKFVLPVAADMLAKGLIRKLNPGELQDCGSGGTEVYHDNQGNLFASSGWRSPEEIANITANRATDTKQVAIPYKNFERDHFVLSKGGRSLFGKFQKMIFNLGGILRRTLVNGVWTELAQSGTEASFFIKDATGMAVGQLTIGAAVYDENSIPILVGTPPFPAQFYMKLTSGATVAINTAGQIVATPSLAGTIELGNNPAKQLCNNLPLCLFTSAIHSVGNIQVKV